VQTFAFPSGTTVELPNGMPLCQTPDAVTYDCLRVVSVGQTPAGRKVFSSHSCAAYSRAADIWSLREHIAQRERGLATAIRKGRRTGHLTDALDHHRRILARMEAEYASDPAPCTCGN
jgi:hypothetical protein